MQCTRRRNSRSFDENVDVRLRVDRRLVTEPVTTSRICYEEAPGRGTTKQRRCRPPATDGTHGVSPPRDIVLLLYVSVSQDHTSSRVKGQSNYMATAVKSIGPRGALHKSSGTIRALNLRLCNSIISPRTTRLPPTSGQFHLFVKRNFFITEEA